MTSAHEPASSTTPATVLPASLGKDRQTVLNRLAVCLADDVGVVRQAGAVVPLEVIEGRTFVDDREVGLVAKVELALPAGYAVDGLAVGVAAKRQAAFRLYVRAPDSPLVPSVVLVAVDRLQQLGLGGRG